MRRRRRASGALLIALALLWLTGTVGTCLAPGLIEEHPFVLALLAPRMSFVAAAVLDVPPWIVVPACTVRLSLGDPLHHELGRRWLGDAQLAAPRFLQPTVVARAQQLVRRVGLPAVGLVPTGPVMLAAGAAGISARRAVPVNLAGTVVRLILLAVLANTAPNVADLSAAITAWAAPITVAVGAGLGVQAWRLGRRRAATRRRHPTCGRIEVESSVPGHRAAIVLSRPSALLVPAP